MKKIILLIVVATALFSCTETSFPKGSVIGWYSKEIPKGWIICDGKNGTPNLVDKFPRGAADASQLNETGGSANYSANTSNCNGHGVSDGYRLDSENDGNIQVTGLNHEHQISVPTIPPYQKIIFIMKV